MRKHHKETVLHATPLSPGIAIGKAFVYQDVLTRDISSFTIRRQDIPHEIKRIANSFHSVKKDLRKLSQNVSKNLSDHEGSIFEAQKLMLEDKEFVDAFEEEMNTEFLNAEQVVRNVFRKYINKLESSADEGLRAKADDLRDLLRKTLRDLLGIDISILGKLPKDSVIVTRRLLPSDTVNLDREHVAGIVVYEGSVHAHSAMLAQSLGIPALTTNGVPDVVIQDSSGIIIDGTDGILVIDPANTTTRSYRNKRAEAGNLTAKKTKVIRSVVKTKSKKTVKVMGNANTMRDVEKAMEQGCDGIGLYRTEMMYLQAQRFLAENELYEKLYEQLSPAKNVSITLRALDIGGDKRLPYVAFEDDVSPYLGLRGIRILLKHQDLLNLQLRVFLRLSADFNIRVLLPMVTVPDDVVAVREIIGQIGKEDGCEQLAKSLPIGAMVETPAAAIGIAKIADVSDFISVGTNDLTQYVMAASRENPQVAEYYDAGLEYIIPLVTKVAKTCSRKQIACSVCGEIANEEKAFEKLIELGVGEFSIAAHNIPRLKALVKHIS